MSDNLIPVCWPQHADPTDLDARGSVAPYNFVPLPTAVLAAPLLPDGSRAWEHHDQYLPGTHSGWIDLEITTETPLYVRCAPPAEHSTEEEPRRNRHRQNFFHHGDPNVPVLPGSSLRGMIRSLVEILAHAALPDGWFSDGRLVYRAVGDPTSLGIEYRGQTLGPNQAQSSMLFDYPSPNLKGGYLLRRGSDWLVQPAREIHGETFVHVEYAAANCGQHDPRQAYGPDDIVEVYVRPPTARTTPDRRNLQLALRMAYVEQASDVIVYEAGAAGPPGFERAFLVRSGHMTGGPRGSDKHMHCAIYAPDDSVPEMAWIHVPPEKRRLYEDDRELPRGLRTRELRPGSEALPIFYLLDSQGNLGFFGPTMMFRLPYPHPIRDFLPRPIRESPVVDLAQAIFGSINRKPAIKGRVFFEDAAWNRIGDPFLGPQDSGLRTPAILGSPKPTAFQHYLVQPELQRHEQDRTRQRPASDNWTTLCHYHHPANGNQYELKDHREETLAETEGTVIRGYKRYWHKREAKPEAMFLPLLVRDTDRRREHRAWKQMTIVRPVRDQAVFLGRVRFENLTDVELGALWTALQLAPHQRHHLGMGKSLGMGSIRIEPRLYVIDRAARYASLFQLDGLGSTGEAPVSDTDALRDRCVRDFQQLVVAHHNSHSSPNAQVNDLWQIPRLLDLAILLEWDQAPPPDLTGFAPPGNPLNNLRWWKDRLVLPTPQGVVGVPARPSARPPHPVPQRPAVSHPPAATQGPSGPPSPPASAHRRVTAPSKRAFNTPTTVKFLGPRPVGKKGYRVQEPGRPEGTLTLGIPPATLPAEGDDIPVLVHIDDPKTPQYKWPS